MADTEKHVRADAPSVDRSVLGRFWTVPNMLTLSRLVLAMPIAILVLVRGSLGWIIALTLAAVATDWFDGRLARWSQSVSGWGKVLDPLVDKIGGGAIVLSLVIRGSLPLWFAGVMVARDALIVLGGVRLAQRFGHLSSSMLAGKIAVTAVALAVLAALLEADPPVMRFCVVASTALLVYSFLRYTWRYFAIVRASKRDEAARARKPAATVAG